MQEYVSEDVYEALKADAARLRLGPENLGQEGQGARGGRRNEAVEEDGEGEGEKDGEEEGRGEGESGEEEEDRMLYDEIKRKRAYGSGERLEGKGGAGHDVKSDELRHTWGGSGRENAAAAHGSGIEGDTGVGAESRGGRQAVAEAQCSACSEDSSDYAAFVTWPSGIEVREKRGGLSRRQGRSAHAQTHNVGSGEDGNGGALAAGVAARAEEEEEEEEEKEAEEVAESEGGTVVAQEEVEAALVRRQTRLLRAERLLAVRLRVDQCVMLLVDDRYVRCRRDAPG